MTRARPGLEVAAAFALLLALVWRAGVWLAPSPATSGLVDTALGVLLAVLVVGTWWRDGIGPRALGLLPTQWGAGWRSMSLFVVLGVAWLATLGAALGTVSLTGARLAWLADYVPGIAAQQLLLHGFFAPHLATLARGLPPRARRIATIGFASAIFAALHTPNPALMGAVAVASAFWTWHFLVHRNLLAVLASHLVLGATAMAALGPGPMLNLRVGPGALELLGR